MLVSQRPASEAGERQGSLSEVLAQLRRSGVSANPHQGVRQRLLILEKRLARVRALGSEYARVSFSPYVESYVEQQAPTV
jgi:hypothetical protein